MKPFLTISLMSLTLALPSCSQEDLEETQRKTIEQALGETYKDTVGIYFKSFRTMCDSVELEDECTRVEAGSTVTFAFTGRIFRGAAFATTDTAEAEAAGIYPMPLYVTQMNGTLLQGVRQALLLMAKGDSANVVFPFTLGYDRTFVGYVPPESAQDWILVVKDVQ